MHLLKLKNRIKVMVRSGSIGLARDLKATAPEGVTHTYRWRGHEIHYRPGTTDPQLIYLILVRRGSKGEYYVPVSIKPRVIFDIGANVGVTTAYLSTLYPDARIYSFEPMPANFAVLSKNAAQFPNVEVFNFGLGADSGSLDLYASPVAANRGGFSQNLYFGSAHLEKTTVQIKGVGEFLQERGIQSVDLIKIDTEGAEDEIIRAFPESVISGVSFIMGELHGIRDFELLAYLAQWFSIGMKKKMHGSTFNFHACNRSIIDDLAETRSV